MKLFKINFEDNLVQRRIKNKQLLEFIFEMKTLLQ